MRLLRSAVLGSSCSKLCSATIPVLIMAISLFVPSVADAVELVRIFELKTEIGRVEEVYRHSEYTLALKASTLPVVLWQIKEQEVTATRGYRAVGPAVFHAVTFSSDSGWHTLDTQGLDTSNTVPTKNGALVLQGTQKAGRGVAEEMPETIYREVTGLEGLKPVKTHASANKDIAVIQCEDGLYLSRKNDKSVRKLTDRRMLVPVFSGGEAPYIAGIQVLDATNVATQRLTVWTSNGDVVYQDADWLESGYTSCFFGADRRYLYVCRQREDSRDPLTDIYVINISEGTVQSIDLGVPRGYLFQTPDRTRLLIVAVSKNPGFEFDATMYALEGGGNLVRMWNYDSSRPLVDGAISDDGTIALVRERVTPSEVELLILGEDGSLTRTGVREAERTRGLGILDDGIVVSGAQISTDSFSSRLWNGTGIYIYQIRE